MTDQTELQRLKAEADAAWAAERAAREAREAAYAAARDLRDWLNGVLPKE